MFKCKTTNNNSSEKGEKTIGEKKKKLDLHACKTSRCSPS